MTRLIEPLLAEMEQEAETTRRVLERVPDDKLSWKPHEKSMTLGQLALHVASIPASVAGILSKDRMDVSEAKSSPPDAESADMLVPQLEKSLRAAKDSFGGLDDAGATAIWTLHRGDKELIVAPRIAMIRTLALNHWYHHRAQLGVYLRLLDIPVPAVYGRSADENPFEAI
jgi:uncharacterized damage-inducible protein DinB